MQVADAPVEGLSFTSDGSMLAATGGMQARSDHAQLEHVIVFAATWLV